MMHFDQLLNDLKLEIFSWALPEDFKKIAQINKNFRQLLQNPIFWKKQLEIHFPDAPLIQDSNKSINYKLSFTEAYKKNYTYKIPDTSLVSKNTLKQRRLFSQVKIADGKQAIELLEPRFYDLLSRDSSGKAAIDWAITKRRQIQLDYFYEIARGYFKDDITKRDDMRNSSLLHWAVLCNQSEEIIAALIKEGYSINDGNKLGNTALHLAIKSGYKEKAKFLIEQGANINAQNKDGVAAIHLAAKKGWDDVIQLLLDKNAKNNDDKLGNTALHFAIKSDHKEQAKFLIEQGANINAQNKDGVAAIHLAAEKGWDDVVQLLLDKNANVNAVNDEGKTPLHYAAANGFINMAKKILKENVDINAITKYGKSAFHFAATEEGHTDMLQLLLENKANVNTVTNTGANSIHLAAARGDKDIVKFLVSKGLKIDALNNQNETALHYAAANGHIQMVEFLLKQGLKIDAPTKNNITPLYLATKNGHEQMVKFLLDKGADIKAARTLDNDTALHRAVGNGYLTIAEILYLTVAEILLNSKADIKAETKEKVTVLEIAIDQKNTKMAQLLLKFGADVNANLSNKVTPLYHAIRDNQFNMAKILLENKADVNTSCTQIKLTPLHLAAKKGQKSIVKLLLRHGADTYAKTNKDQTPYQLLQVKLKSKRKNSNRFFNNANNQESSPQDNKFIIALLDLKDYAEKLQQTLLKNASKQETKIANFSNSIFNEKTQKLKNQKKLAAAKALFEFAISERPQHDELLLHKEMLLNGKYLKKITPILAIPTEEANQKQSSDNATSSYSR